MSSVAVTAATRFPNWDFRAEVACVGIVRQSFERRRRRAELQADARMFAALDDADLLALGGLIDGSVGVAIDHLATLRARWGIYPDILREEIACGRRH